MIVAVALIAGLAFNIRVATLNSSGWGIDFNQFYSAGQLVGSGHLYDWESLRKIEDRHGHEVPTGRLPVVLYVQKLLGRFPYRVAQTVWMAFGIAALIGFIFIWPGALRSSMAVAVAWSMPVTLFILFGQDTSFWLAFFAAGLLFLERKKPWAAGIAFSLCICKFHLGLGIPILLAAQKQWKTLISGTVSFLVLIAGCFLIEGPGWPAEYLKMAQMPAFSPTPDVMPTLSVLTSRLPWPIAAEIAGSIGILVLLWTVCRKTCDIGMAGAATAACGLLVAHHALFADTALLLPLAALTIHRESAPPWLKAWAVLMLSPFLFLLASVAHNSLVWQASIAPFVVIATASAPTLAPRSDRLTGFAHRSAS